MPSKFASGKKAIAECDRCGFRYKLKELRSLVIKALRNPRPDTSYFQSGLNDDGNPSQGSRDIQWGWGPVGFSNPLNLTGLPNNLEASGQVGIVTVSTS
jgi:hypothetical protein